MNYHNAQKIIIAGIVLFLNMSTLWGLKSEQSVFSVKTEFVPRLGYFDCSFYYPLSWEYELKNRRGMEEIDLANTESIIVILMHNSSALDNYKILQMVMDYYKNYPDTPEMRVNFERIVAAYFFSSTEVEARDFYLFNLVYDVALKLAYSINFKAIADVMFKYVGSLNQQNQYGETPAHVFVKNAALAAGHFFEVLHLFQEHGANFTEIKDFAQKSVYDYMIERSVGYMMREGVAKDITIFVVREYLKSQGFDLN